VGLVTATAAHSTTGNLLLSILTYRALVGAGFRRYATYRQATVAGAVTNTVFGFLRCYVLLAVAAGLTLRAVARDPAPASGLRRQPARPAP
jgi:ABC-2 type transport system permease protein